MTEETAQDDPAEEVDAELVPSQTRVLEPIRAAPLSVQAAAMAATGFVAGAATVAVVRHHRAKKARRLQRRTAHRQLANVLASRSFLVDVHLLGGRDN